MNEQAKIILEERPSGVKWSTSAGGTMEGEWDEHKFNYGKNTLYTDRYHHQYDSCPSVNMSA